MDSRLVAVVISVFCFMTALLSLSEAEVKGPQSYGTCYQNITSDRDDSGFIQIIGLAINRTNVLVEGDNTSFHQFDIVRIAGLGAAEALNYTPEYQVKFLKTDDPVNVNSPRISNFGIVASSTDPIHLYGVKSDKGTTDGYMCLPQTNNSREFMIVGWEKLINRPFLSTIMAVPVESGTCCSLYKIHNGNQYQLVASESINKFQLFRYFANNSRYIDSNGKYAVNTSKGEDVTGYYLNCSRPVQVIYGHECAWVPDPTNLFCDYIAEQMIPINQLGQVYVVPMIIGRSTAAGYVVRVVPAQDNTEITYLGTLKVIKRLGEFLQFESPRTDQPTAVVCSKPCAVYMYNKGYLQYNDVPTDPFMMAVTPNDRFTAGAPFGTASFCRDKNLLVEFDNAVTVVTFASYQDRIRFDDEPISNLITRGLGSVTWTPITAGSDRMVATSFRVSHGYHYVSIAPGQVGSFAVYAYGHSRDVDSSSAYGYSCNYNSTGQGVSKTYDAGKSVYPIDSLETKLNQTCTKEEYLTGSVISSKAFGYVPFPFTLRAAIEPNAVLSPECLGKYKDQLTKLLQEFSRKINYWICTTKNCTYLNGEGVAIDYSSLKVTFIGSQGVYSAVEVSVNMIARPEVTSKNFATCRAEIQNYMYEFINWPPQYTRYLINQIVGSNCPWPLAFQQPRFTAKPVQCPVTYNKL